MKQTTFTIQDIKNSKVAGINPHLTADPVKGKSKYGNKKVEFDGYTFDSKKECRTYIGLRARQSAGEITELKLQVPFELNEGGTHSLRYIADFTYLEDGRLIVVDAKGYRTKVYKKKARLMKEVHGIEIKEV